MKIGTLHLRRVIGVTAAGDVRLEGTNARILQSGPIDGDDIGRRAVCQFMANTDDPTLVVLGLLEEPTDTPQDAPLVLENGESCLSLHPDGRIELKGEAITVDSATRLSLLAAQIDLN